MSWMNGVTMQEIIWNLIQRYDSGKLTRRDLMQGLAILASGVAMGPTAMTAPAAAALPAVCVNHIAVTVSDLKKSSQWYKDLFGLKVESEDDKVANLLLDNSSREALVLRPGANPGRISHFCFGVKDFDMKKAEAELKARNLDPRPDN